MKMLIAFLVAGLLCASGLPTDAPETTTQEYVEPSTAAPEASGSQTLLNENARRLLKQLYWQYGKWKTQGNGYDNNVLKEYEADDITDQIESIKLLHDWPKAENEKTRELIGLDDTKTRRMLKSSGNIVVGAGYSGDTQQVVSQVCYNAAVSSTSAQQGYVQLDTAMSSTELENILGISVSISGIFGMFSGEAKATYIRSVQDTDYSMSLNYYQYARNNVAVNLAGYGENALTESGKAFYNDSKNPYFGLICGDHYISSYEQGALLTMGLNIKFINSNSKQEFEQKAGASFGDIVRATESIKKIVAENKMTGSVIIQAFQMGGKPSQLAGILNKDSSGQYHALECSLTNMDQCHKAAIDLLDYAKYNFSKQFSIQNNTGLTPLGIAFSQYIPIEYIGLVPPVSLVTPEVVQYREDLSGRLKENEYYLQKLYPFLIGDTR